MVGDVELIFYYKDWKSVSDVIESLKRLSDISFIESIYKSSFNPSVGKLVPFGNQNIMYSWGVDSLIITFDW